MQKVYLFAGNAWPFYSSRWGKFEKEFSHCVGQYEENKIIRNHKKHIYRNNRKQHINLNKFKIIRSKVRKKKIDYLKNIKFDYFNISSERKGRSELSGLYEKLTDYMQDISRMKLVEEKALAGDSKSQLKLARCYLLGYKRNGLSNIGLAIYWSKLASENNVKAKRFLAYIYLFYIKNYKKAYRLFNELAEIGEVLPQFMTEILQALFNEQVHVNTFVKKQLEIYRNCGKVDDESKARACYLLGLCYYCGILGKQNYKKAFIYLNEAVELNLVNAYFLVGNFYEHGFTSKVDVKKSIKYYNLAIDHNDQWAIYHLGRLYFRGKLLERDLDKALFYFQKGSEGGFLPSKEMMRKINCMMSKHEEQ